MATITVVRPDHAGPDCASPDHSSPDHSSDASDVCLAPRQARDSAEPMNVTLIENGKPNARRLLGFVADELESRLPLAGVDVHSKPSAGKPIDADVADMLAARSHLVISGVGD